MSDKPKDLVLKVDCWSFRIPPSGGVFMTSEDYWRYTREAFENSLDYANFKKESHTFMCLILRVLTNISETLIVDSSLGRKTLQAVRKGAAIEFDELKRQYKPRRLKRKKGHENPNSRTDAPRHLSGRRRFSS